MKKPTCVPMIVATDLPATRRFYEGGLGWKVVFDQENYLQVRREVEGDAFELAFCREVVGKPLGAPLRPLSRGALAVSIPSEGKVDAYCEALRAKGMEILSEPSDKPWTWRSFLVADPAGTLLDFYQAPPEAPAAGNA